MKPLPFSTIAVIYSLPTQRVRNTFTELTDDDTALSAKKVNDALRRLGFRPTLVPISEDRLDSILNLRADCIFNLIEWTGADAQLGFKAMEYLETLQIPFTGGAKQNFMMATDKVLMKQALIEAGIPTPHFQIITEGTETLSTQFHFPLIAKLSLEHCSIGLSHESVADNELSLWKRVRELIQTYHQPVIVEEYIEGRELHIPLVEKNGHLIVLPATEIIYPERSGRSFLTYESRWEVDHPDFKTSTLSVPVLPTILEQELTDLSIKTFQRLGFRDYSRLDLRLSPEGKPLVLEANCNPGLDDDPEYEMARSVLAAGWSFDILLETILESVWKRTYPIYEYNYTV